MVPHGEHDVSALRRAGWDGDVHAGLRRAEAIGEGGMSDEFSTVRAGFMERVAELAGGTTYRMPVGGQGTGGDRMPDAHAIAASLAYARRGPTDIGPDIAVAIATGSVAHRTRIVMELSAALLACTGRVGDRAAHFLLTISAHCYLCVTGTTNVERPLGVSERDYTLLRSMGEGILRGYFSLMNVRTRLFPGTISKARGEG
jgi:hypothetical protein